MDTSDLADELVACNLCGADRQPRYSSDYTLKMALWFFSYTMSPVIVIVYDVSIVIVYDISLLLPYRYS